MTTNATTNPEPATAPDTGEPATPTPPPTSDGEWLIGDHYDNTADMSMTQIAETLHMDLRDIRTDDMLPRDRRFRGHCE